MLCVIGRVTYHGYKNGLIPEFFQLIGIYCATIFTFHFYVRLGAGLKHILFFIDPSGEFLAYLLLSIAILTCFSLFQEGWLTLLKIEIPPVLDQWAGMLMAGVKSILICGLLYIGIFVTQNGLLISLSESSLSQSFGRVSANIYQVVYEKGIVALFPSEPLTKNVFTILSPSHPEDEELLFE
jgi:hypothetical protein